VPFTEGTTSVVPIKVRREAPSSLPKARACKAERAASFAFASVLAVELAFSSLLTVLSGLQPAENRAIPDDRRLVLFTLSR